MAAVETPCCAPGVPGLIEAEPAEQLAALFKALADPTRVRLLGYLAASESGTACACHLPDALGISQPTLSFHLKKLHQSGLITREQRGRWAHYTVHPQALAAVREWLSDPGCC